MQIMNPYLPLHEHIPDGEPHVFGDRVYVIGSRYRGAGAIDLMDFELNPMEIK